MPVWSVIPNGCEGSRLATPKRFHHRAHREIFFPPLVPLASVCSAVKIVPRIDVCHEPLSRAGNHGGSPTKRMFFTNFLFPSNLFRACFAANPAPCLLEPTWAKRIISTVQSC